MTADAPDRAAQPAEPSDNELAEMISPLVKGAVATLQAMLRAAFDRGRKLGRTEHCITCSSPMTVNLGPGPRAVYPGSPPGGESAAMAARRIAAASELRFRERQ